MYQHPLAYLIGVEGLSLLRSFTGEHDGAFVQARLAEVRRLLDDPRLADGVQVDRVSTVDGYRRWAASYDGEGNAAFDLDEPLIGELLDDVKPGVALDAACGTGRVASLLAGRGFDVVGVDSSPDMLARVQTPGEFRHGDLHDLPLPDASVDVVVCALALCHVPDLRPPFGEFARVLRPGGRLIVSDMHPEALLRGSIPPVRDEDGRPGRLAVYHHRVGDYLRAALAAGLRLERCEEPVLAAAEQEATSEPGPWDLWPWSLAAMVPHAARAANEGVPGLLVCRFGR